MKVRHIAAQGAALVLIACGQTSDGSVFTVSDSAGIPVVSIRPEGITDTLDLAAEPSWSIESIKAPESHYWSGVRLQPADEGRVLVGESDGHVWIGDPVAERWTRIAAPGDGPADIGAVQAVRFVDGSVWVVDSRRRRLVEFDVDGSLVSERSLTGDRGLATADWAPSSEGHLFLGSGPGWEPSNEVIQRPPAPVVRVSTTHVDTLFHMPNIEWFHTDWGTGAPLLRPSGYLIGDADGAWTGFSAVPEIRRWTDSVTVVVRWSVAPWDARALADSVIDSALASPEAAQYPPEIVEQVRSIPLSPSPLKFDGLVLRHDGGVVIGPRWATCCGQGRRPAGPWMALDSDGIPQYFVNLPIGFGPAYFGPDYVLGVAVDELGRETIQRWELIGRP